MGVQKGGRELRVRVEGQLVFNGVFPVLDAALAGLGLVYVPEDLAQPHLAKGRLKLAGAVLTGSGRFGAGLHNAARDNEQAADPGFGGAPERGYERTF